MTNTVYMYFIRLEKKIITLLFTEIEFYINLVKSKNAKIGNGNYLNVLFATNEFEKIS